MKFTPKYTLSRIDYCIFDMFDVQLCSICGADGHDYEFRRCSYVHPESSSEYRQLYSNPPTKVQCFADKPSDEFSLPFEQFLRALDQKVEAEEIEPWDVDSMKAEYWKYEHYVCPSCFIPVKCESCGHVFEDCHRPSCYPYCRMGQRGEMRNEECR